LRRLMFWHGRGFGVRFTEFILWCLFKSIACVFAKVAFNLENGFSAHQPSDGLLFALYNVTMTVQGISWYCGLDHDISFTKYNDKEHLMSFNLAEYYAFSRKQIQQFYKVYAV